LAARAAKYYNKDVEVVLHGVTGASVTVRWRDGGPVLQHEYYPRTWLEHLLAGGLYASQALRPTLLALASPVVAVPRARKPSPTWIFASRGPVMPWPVYAANVGLALLLAGLAFRRLGNYGLSPARRWSWVAVTFLGGLPAFLCLRFIETRRAWQPVAVPVEPAAVPPLVIASA
jgi:hypothetical protein